MKEITSKKTGKIQIISEDTWDEIVEKGWEKKFKVIDIPARTLKDVPKIERPIEIKTKTKKKI